MTKRRSSDILADKRHLFLGKVVFRTKDTFLEKLCFLGKSWFFPEIWANSIEIWPWVFLGFFIGPSRFFGSGNAAKETSDYFKTHVHYMDHFRIVL